MLLTVVEYNPIWINEFESESKKLQYILGDIVNNIYHIGSTAVPGLMAKPIIDIMLDVTKLEGLDTKTEVLEALGYEAMGEFGISGRRYFRKGGENRTHQIHAFQSGDSNLIRHLVFRDYLIEHEKIAKEYGILKSSLAKTCNNDREKYGDGKDAFIKYHETAALKWCRQFSLANSRKSRK